MLKRDELRTATSCLNRAGDDEPIFVLRANDPVAAQTIRFWANMAEDFHEEGKLVEALALADQFAAWRRAKDHPGGPGGVSPSGPRERQKRNNAGT